LASPDSPIPLQIIPEQYRSSFQELEFRDGIAKAISLTKNGGHKPPRADIATLSFREHRDVLDSDYDT